MTFSQHYRWTTPYIIEFVDQVRFGAFGAIAGSATLGLMEIRELLKISNEQEVSGVIVGLQKAIVDQHRGALNP